MGYMQGASVVRFGLIALVSAQLVGCATAREVTRGTGMALGVGGALALLVAMDPDCDPDSDRCGNDEPVYEAETMDTRAIIAAGGGAALLLGGGLVAATDPPKRRRTKPVYKPVAQPVVSAPKSAPSNAEVHPMRELIEKRCVPAGGIDLRVPEKAEVPRTIPPACEVNGPAVAPAPVVPAPSAPAPAP